MTQYYISAFIAGFSLMAVEITSSRIIAPIIGSSIFTWTSVIGIILLGLTVGSLLGGKIADKCSKRYGQKVLSIAMLASSFFIYLIIPLSKNIDFILNKSFSIMTLSVIICILLFFLPSLAMGTISPIIFNLYVSDIKNIGKKYGLISGLWSLGSILGVFITGFYFISKIGSSGAVYLISMLLLSFFYFFYIKNLDKSSPYFKYQMIFIVSVSLLFLFSLFFNIQKKYTESSKIIFQKETAYYAAKVVDYDLYPQFGKNRLLLLDIDSHSIQTKKQSKKFYTDIYPVFSVFSDKIKKIHIIGAGAYTLPINLRKHYSESDISVSEIDPEVEKIGYDYFDLGKYNIQTKTGDARIFFNARQKDKYDLIYGDAYNSFISVPWHLLTKEFVLKLKDNLNLDGIYAINFIGSIEGKNSKIFESIYSTINEVFPNNYIFSFGTDPREIQSITILGVKNNKYISHNSLTEKLREIDSTHFLSRILLNKDNINNGRGIKKRAVLTDDLSPVEYMMSGLMNEYFSRYFLIYRKIISAV